LELVRSLSLICQQRDLFVGDLSAKLGMTLRLITDAYITPYSRYTQRHTPELIRLLHDIGGYGSALGWSANGTLVLRVVWGRERSATAASTAGWYGPWPEQLKVVELTARPPSSNRRVIEPVTPLLLAEVMQSVQSSLTAAATAVVAELRSRFPSSNLLSALGILYPAYWQADPTEDGLLKHLQIIKDNFCNEGILTAADGTTSTVQPPLNGALLDEQLAAFTIAMEHHTAKGAGGDASAANSDAAVVEDDNAAPDVGHVDSERGQQQAGAKSPVTELWRKISSQPAIRNEISEFVRLAKLGLVMVPSSVEEERMFSLMGYLKDDVRNRLQQSHLNVCIRLFRSSYSVKSFPYSEAAKIWLEQAAVRGRYKLGSK
jgi:hypothetical protein